MLPCQPLAVTLPYMGDADGDVRHSIKDARRLKLLFRSTTKSPFQLNHGNDYYQNWLR